MSWIRPPSRTFRAALRLASSLALTGAVLLLVQSAADARQAAAGAEPVPSLADDPRIFLERLWPESAPTPAVDPEPEPSGLLASPTPFQSVAGLPNWSLGAALGLLGARGADSTSLFGEGEFRWWMLDWLGIQAAGSAYRTAFQDGAIVCSQIQVQGSVVIAPFPRFELVPYLLGGAGYYYTTAEYHKNLSGVFPTDRTSSIGYHGAVGIDWVHNSVSIFLQGVYVIVDPLLGGMSHSDFNHWEALAGMTLRF
jgi:hypothetical protein